MNLETLLADRLRPAFAAVAGVPVDPAVHASQHADLQSGAALAVARALGRPPREVAAEVAAAADLTGLATAEVSGPGFLNLTVDNAFLVTALDAGPETAPATPAERVVIDYSGPNVAKDLHVGHLRSTVIGDALARILQWAGHDVIRVNHLGDWGTQFGMLIEHLTDVGEDAAGDRSLADLTGFYRAARVRFDGDDDFRDRARRRVVALQSGDPASRAAWRELVGRSEQAFLAVYARLGVTLAPGDFVGESFYQDRLGAVVAELGDRGLLTESDGALCAFPPGFTGRDGGPLPFIVRKSDGGFGYAATDLAALRYRVRELGATRLLYVVGAPQRTHFRMLFAVARQAGWLDEKVTAEHIEFGAILGTDGRMLKTRSGDTIRLSALLDEATTRATEPAIGIGAIKYADLSSDRRSDYVFDWDRMLAATGDTGPYLQYALTRIRSLFRKAEADAGVDPDPARADPARADPARADPARADPGRAVAVPVAIDGLVERRLALTLLAFEPAVQAAADRREPHRLASYLHEVAVAFNAFYVECPILRAPDLRIRAGRLALAARTARTLALGLDLLGIESLETM